MRILYHHRTLGDGAEGVHIAAMLTAFRQLGHEVLLSGVTPALSPGSSRRLIGGVRSMLPKMAFELGSAGAGVLEYVNALRVIERAQPTFVYSRHARFDVATLAAAKKMGVPSVLEVNCVFTSPQYEQFEPHAMRRLARMFERKSVELATRVVAVSTPLAAAIHELGRRDVTAIPNGADPSHFDPHRFDGNQVRGRHGLGSGLIVGWAGILREWHGLDLLLAALVSVPDARLLIVGDGPARPALERRARDLGLHDRVVITGRVVHEEMPNYIAAMDIAVVADERTGVASPMKLLEYMSMARAVVAPRKDNIRDLIDEDVDGLLFSAGRADELGAKLHALASNGQLRASLGSSARRKVERERNWQGIAERVLLLVG
jgi:glycosyltransferase involved in cell wall biosynthesis